MILTSIIGIHYFKMNGLELLGALTGGMTSTPGLAAVEPLSDSDAPKVAYATIYPIAMVLLIVLIQFLL
jgi:putative transport protein